MTPPKFHFARSLAVLAALFVFLPAEPMSWASAGFEVAVSTNEDHQVFEIRNALGMAARIQSSDDLTAEEGDAVVFMVTNLYAVPGLKIRVLRLVVEEALEGLLTPQSFMVDGTNVLACLPTGVQVRYDKGMRFRAPMVVGKKKITIDEPWKTPEVFAKRLKLGVEDPDRFIKQSTDAIALGLMKTRLAALQADMEREKAVQVLQQAQAFSNLMEALLTVPDSARREKYLRRALSITNPDLSRVFQARLYLQANEIEKARVLVQGDDSPKAILVRLLMELRQGTAYVTNGFARWRELSWTTEEPIVGQIGLSFLAAEGGEVAAARTNYGKATNLGAAACADEFEISGTGLPGNQYLATLRVAEAFPALAQRLLRPFYRTVDPPESPIDFTLLPGRSGAEVDAAVVRATLPELCAGPGRTVRPPGDASRSNALYARALVLGAASGIKGTTAEKQFIGWVDRSGETVTLEGVLSDMKTGKTLKTVRGLTWNDRNFKEVWTVLARDLMAAVGKK